MTHRRMVTRRQRIERQQEAADISGMREPHDPTNGDGVNQNSGNVKSWSPSHCLDLGQDDQDGQVT
jgi:hypothetical protein